MTQLDDLIREEGSKYGVPPWILLPLIGAESSFDPHAENAGHYGLLQLSPDYPGAGAYSTAQLEDPRTNLEVALPQLAKAYRDAGSPPDSLQAFETVISHSGWDTWRGWSAENPNEAANYIKHYNDYETTVRRGGDPLAGLGSIGANAGQVAGDVGSWLDPRQSINQIGNNLGQAGNQIGGFVAGINNAKDALGAFKDGLGWVKDHPGALLLLLVALVILVTSGAHLYAGMREAA